MALKERQIQRYARQVLLADVGGKGQEALLNSGAIALSGGGPADSVGLAYLAAGGTPVRVPNSRAVSRAELGFLFDTEDVGKPALSWLKSALKDFNPDAAREPRALGLLAELPAQVISPAPWIVIGWSAEGRGGVLYRSTQGCASCFIHSLKVFPGDKPDPALAVALGALGALAFQRCTLGLSEPLGGHWLGADGALTPVPITRCDDHRAQ